MNSREKLLGVAIGGLLVLVLGYYLFDRLEQGLTTTQQQITRLEQQKADLRKRVGDAKKAEARWAEYRLRSLPADREQARAQYQEWLLKQLDDIGLAGATINAVAAPGRGDAFHNHSFKITCKGNIDQLTRWLYNFYSVDRLQRLRQLTIKPVVDSKLLDLSLTIEVLSLSDAETRELPSEPSPRIDPAGLTPYVAAIVGRNLFQPANQPPKLVSVGTQRGNPKKSLSFTLKADDPDKLDKVSFAFVDEAPQGAKLDSRTGEFQWTPPANGEYDVTVEAKDDGFPAKTARQKIRLVVTDPPPPPEPVAVKPTKKKLDFDPARWTILSGIIEQGAVREVWLTIRTRTTDEIQKLHEGDELNIGSIEGTIRQINANSFDLVTPEKQLRVYLGEHLLQARELPLKPDAAAVERD